MYCTNCGRKLPEDGSPCVCRQQPAQPEQQTYTQPVQPQQNYGAPAQNFQAPPQYYAQPPVQYPVQPPVSPVTPVHGMLKRFASSKLFFMCALLFTVQMVVSAVSSVIEVFTVLQNQAYLLERTPVGTNFNVEFNVNIVPVQNILVLIGLWLLYASAKKTDTPFMSTAGVTLFKVTEILQIVGCGIFCGMLLLIGLLVLLASSGAPNVTNYTGLPDNIAILIVGIAFVVGLVLSVLLLLYSIKMLGVWTSLQRAIQVGVLPKKLPGYALALQGFSIFCDAAAMIAFFVLNAWILIPGSLCSIAARVYVIRCMAAYNREVAGMEAGSF